MKQKDDISIELVDAGEFRHYLETVKSRLVSRMEEKHLNMYSREVGYLIDCIINKLDKMIIGD